MKKYILLLFLGLFIGFYIYPKSQNEIPKNSGHDEDSLANSSKQSQSITQIPKVNTTTSPSEKESETTTHLAATEDHKELITEQKKNVKMRLDKFLNIHLEEPIIDQLEHEIDSLKQSVYTEHGEMGWKIHISTGSHFLITGFQDGDLISDESFENQIANPEKSELANRFISLLSQLQR